MIKYDQICNYVQCIENVAIYLTEGGRQRERGESLCVCVCQPVVHINDGLICTA